MLVRTRSIAVALLFATLFAMSGDAVEVQESSSTLSVAAHSYRIHFARESLDFRLEMRTGDGAWRLVTLPDSVPEYACFSQGEWYSSASLRASFAWKKSGDVVVVGVSGVLNPVEGVSASIHYLCTEKGVLIQFRLFTTKPPEEGASCWALPRLRLDHTLFDSYTFWDETGRQRNGSISNFTVLPAYAGVTPWEQQGDVTSAFSPETPALIVRSEKAEIGLGVVRVDADSSWQGEHTFLQLHVPGALFLYSGYVSASKTMQGIWGWLAPLSGVPAAQLREQVASLQAEAQALIQHFLPIAPQIPPDRLQEPPDFPEDLRPKQPVRNIHEAIVYTVNEAIHSPYGITLARKVGSDVLIRAWFKWGNAPDWSAYSPLVQEAHRIGALFGGGTTCSVFYHGENGITEQQALDMATRDPAGNLVDVAGVANCRHGTLSNPAYLEYILTWCKKQIDAGADYLFMDEHTAALQTNEGYDDYSLRDFVRYLKRKFCDELGWKPDDLRWKERFDIDLADPAICPNGTIESFQYRAYLRQKALLDAPTSERNPLRDEWWQFRTERDDRAWKWLTDAIRDYARQKGRRVYLSANGLAKYVDLQVLGVWGLWKTRDGRVDLSESQIPGWYRTVREGWYVAGRRVPVVFFHDWGFDGFPWMRATPSERELWMRTRGAEIYAAGGFFAFPVLGPFGNDALRDGTLREVAKQSAFYRRHQHLYLHAQPVDIEVVKSEQPLLSTALWLRQSPPALIVHVVNRQVQRTELVRRRNVVLTVPVQTLPQKATAFSPDGQAQRVRVERAPEGIRLYLPELIAYSVVVLEYPRLPAWSRGYVPRVIPTDRWEKAPENLFRVQPGGIVEDGWKMVTYLQGTLHQQMRQPPTFVLNAPRGARLHVHVRAVAQAGANLLLLVDGAVRQRVDLPDRDGKNDGTAREYDRVFTFRIPAGAHRVTLDNQGSDWVAIDWLAFEGEFR